MMKNLLVTTAFLVIIIGCTNQKAILAKKNQLLREQHNCFIENSPFKETLSLNKQERKNLGLPPNKYFETEWENSINPVTGVPDFENLELVRQQLADQRQQAAIQGRTPGDAIDNSWVERGPTNVGGRVRAIMFDPNDATNETVFAGGVSGGLWKNTSISNPNSPWTQVNIPDNLSISCITFDPNNNNIFYLGTGESYTGSDAIGNGVWKSTNAGSTWTKIFGGNSGTTYFQSASTITVNEPASIAGDKVSLETTAFGPSVYTLTAEVVLVNDGASIPTSLGCVAFTNAAEVNGKIALIRRGSCNFTVKLENAVNAGAAAVIIINNAPGSPIAIGGTDPGTITIPSVMISKVDGDAIEAALPNGTVTVTMNPDNGLITGTIVPGKQYINDIKVRNNNGVSELYVAAGDAAGYGALISPDGYGLYKSTNGGTSWTELDLPLSITGKKLSPNDIEIGSDNKIWIATTNSVAFAEGGGKILSSSDGVIFSEKYQITNGLRTQIAVSKANANLIYVLGRTGAGITLFKTTDGFATTAAITPPVNSGSQPAPAADFTNGQAFYNLTIAVDPTNDQKIFVGGLDLHKSVNGGSSWSQLSDWTGGAYQYVHADQHAIAFGKNDSNKMVFGNDGGVNYSGNNGTSISNNITGLNITQFYSLGVAPTNAVSGLVGDYFVAGAQDNGSQYFANAATNNAQSNRAQGGDGAFSMFDQGADKYYITNYIYNQSVNSRSTTSGTKTLNSVSTNNGQFICPMVLDSNRDIVFSDYTTTNTTTNVTTYQIQRYTNVRPGVGTLARLLLSNALLTSNPTAFAVSKYTTASTTLLVGTRNSKILKLTNANATPTWTDISSINFVGTVSDVEFGNSENEIFVTFQNYNVKSIWYTADGGVTWQDKEGNFPDIPVKCILRNPLLTNEVIIGTEIGVWFTNNFNDAAPNWRQSNNGMKNVKVTDLDLRNDNMVFAATYGRGIFSGSFTNTVLTANSFSNNAQIAVYPNPTTDVLNVEIPNYSNKVQIKISDINGKLILNQNLTDFNNQKAINISQFTAGVYFLEVTGENLNFSKKIIKN